MNHPMSVIAFQENRPEQFDFVTKELVKTPKAIISMPVKSGKRVVVQCEARLDMGFKEDGNVKHIFATSFKRNDCNEQMIEMEKYGIKVFCGGKLRELPEHVKTLLERGETPVLHYDESDFGTGDVQMASSVFTRLVNLPDDGWEKLKVRCYSATNEEAIYSPFADECKILEPTMPTTFRHAPWFLEKGLVEEAEEFWCSDTQTFSPQALSALAQWKHDDKPFAVVRFAASRGERNTHYNSVKHSKKFKDDLHAMGIDFVKFVDNRTPFYWGKDHKNPEGWGAVDKSRKMLLVLNQMCIRSTEVGFHPLISFWHDFRGGHNTPYSTCAQAMFRVNHYDYEANPEAWDSPEVNIKVYACLDSFRFAAGQINEEEYKRRTNRKLSIRIGDKNTDLSRNPDHYQIFDMDDHDEFMEAIAAVAPGAKPFKRDADGIYRNTFRGEITQWNRDKLETEMWSGLDEDTTFRKRVYYVGDKPRFWAIKHSGVMDNRTVFQTRKSMYSKGGSLATNARSKQVG